MRARELIAHLAKCDPEAEVEIDQRIYAGHQDADAGDPLRWVHICPPEHPGPGSVILTGGDADPGYALACPPEEEAPPLPQQAQRVLSAIGAVLVQVGQNVYVVSVDFEPTAIDVKDWERRTKELRAAIKQAVESTVEAFGFDEARASISIDFPPKLEGLEPVGPPHMRAHVKLNGRVQAERWTESSTGTKFPRVHDQ